VLRKIFGPNRQDVPGENSIKNGVTILFLRNMEAVGGGGRNEGTGFLWDNLKT
jgi:hypothetical protein